MFSEMFHCEILFSLVSWISDSTVASNNQAESAKIAFAVLPYTILFASIQSDGLNGLNIQSEKNQLEEALL